MPPSKHADGLPSMLSRRFSNWKVRPERSLGSVTTGETRR
jgi:hypothetical protein